MYKYAVYAKMCLYRVKKSNNIVVYKIYLLSLLLK